MEQYKSVASLKGIARTHMFGNYKPAIGAYITMSLILTTISIMVSTILPEGQVGTIFSGAFYILYFLLTGIFTSGQAYLYLSIACGAPVVSGFIFYGFKNNTDKALMIQACLLGGYLVPSIPLLLIVRRIYGGSALDSMFPMLIAAIVVAIVGIVVSNMLLMPAFFLIHDFPNYSFKQILELSLKLMRKNMGRLFILYVSFIPIQLLELVTFGIGALWVEPYRYATFAEFFLDIMRSKDRVQ